jgi:hypothetical protein
MAINLNTSVKQKVLIYSSQLPDLDYTTDNDIITVAIWDTADRADIFITDLYTYNGKVLFYGVRDVVEQYMRNNGLTYINIIIEAQNDNGDDLIELDLKVLYASFTPNIQAPQFARQNFLTTLTAKTIDRKAMERIYFYAEKDEVVPIKHEIISLDWQGNIVHTVIESTWTATKSQVQYVDMAYMDLYDRAGREACKAVVSVRLLYGERVFMFYFDDERRDVNLYFRNAFNLWERIYLKGTTKVKTSMEKSEAVAAGKIVHYNRRSSQKHEVKLAPMRTEEAEWMAQFLLSHHIYKDEQTESNRILIDDFSHEVTDDDDQLHKVEFTWRFADKDKLPLSFPTEHNPNMFANEFTEPFE